MSKQLKSALACVLFFAMSFSGQALEKTTSFYVGVDDATVEAVGEAIIYSLNYRGWVVDNRDDPRILSHLYKRGTEADLIIDYTERKVTIKTTAFRLQQSTDPMTIGQVTRNDYYPRGWISNIKKDVIRVLPRISAELAKKKEAEVVVVVDIKEELDELKKLFEQGLITKEVYDQMQLKLLEKRNVL
ncbi:hypothetical protein EZV61_12385 [Corallincola luteus]|uniref:SHOCT domain-containing protein n=2 Tax=Corallincola TaxID=1775176 RepID=A0A368N4P8_9GAMM|nr:MULTISPECIES: hypothetical protein [Corallincola]RCU45522.1 hypothetical protein DU002_15855 [Corallincola holothuriorum]TCI02595.1 hypothetical protein EZV61_12385 [Corallincola luteus]